ncbi:Zn-dependent hydrolase [Microtetraspora sp. NBRC 13810]|uniref:allantoate amidohydrolase n=1 Tax=Microtetraspora sp. NBRC 13810 TaxID=3030990 RepID=UPI0024A16AE9|nr:allantoate amidohydrolase [Microtetraspora sp. NBRC 13810]GLW04961.1 Zn-dependent hydrolase [Microtetraspora sp. NBRC 13810]
MRRFDGMWRAVADVGRDRRGGYARDAWSAADLELREWFRQEAGLRDLAVREDRNGNLWAWWGDPGSRPGVVTGSHLDSVRQGGAFDGPLGVVSAFAAIDALRERGVRPGRPLGVACFTDEEGARFGVPCVGSRLLTGVLDPARACGLTDDEGDTLADVLRAAGRSPQALGRDEETLRHVGVFVELHVEQGKGLVDEDAAVGVASAIRPHGRWRFDFRGRADHAGTTLLADRDDPMLPFARTVLLAREAAERHGVVATVGKVRVEPGSANAIPARVSAWLDARGPEESAVRALVAELTGAAGAEVECESWTPVVDFDAALRDRLAGALGGVPVLPTGAGHDAGVLASAGVPSAMVFVRNPTGISHSPEEYAEPGDCHAGVAALARVLEELCD